MGNKKSKPKPSFSTYTLFKPGKAPPLVEYLHAHAKLIGYHIARVVPNCSHNNDWASYRLHEDLVWKIQSTGNYCFRRGGNKTKYTLIKFSGVTPTRIKSSKFHKPVIMSGKTEKTAILNVDNPTPAEQEVDYTYTKGTSSTTLESVGVSVLVGFEQKIGTGVVGGSFVKNETKFKAEVTTEYNKQREEQKQSVTTRTTKLKVPSFTSITAVQEFGTANVEQKIDYTCDFDFAIQVWSHKDYDHRWKTKTELIDVLEGEGHDKQALAVLYRKNPWSKERASRLFKDVKPISTTVTIRSRDSEHGKITFQSEPIRNL